MYYYNKSLGGNIMKKRHQVTKLEKYEENKKGCNIFKYVSVATLAIQITLLSLELSVPAKNVKDIIVIILSSLFMPVSLSNLIDATVEKYYTQQKIDELKEQEENQSRSR